MHVNYDYTQSTKMTIHSSVQFNDKTNIKVTKLIQGNVYDHQCV